jgi:hypothetical protein|tara:strand:- start:444 stop:629 length:186 start_codon:yes stop_codon:yes gene_type:complete
MTKEIWGYGILYYDPNAGEGEIDLSQDFYDEHFVIQLDILQDWRDYLDNLYDKTLEESRKL